MDDPKEGKKFCSLLTLPQLAKLEPNIKIGFFGILFCKNRIAMVCEYEQTFGVPYKSSKTYSADNFIL